MHIIQEKQDKGIRLYESREARNRAMSQFRSRGFNHFTLKSVGKRFLLRYSVNPDVIFVVSEMQNETK